MSESVNSLLKTVTLRCIMKFIQNYEYFLGINKTGVGMEGLVFVQGRLTFNIIHVNTEATMVQQTGEKHVHSNVV